jgi:CRP-like cAMP-binding protein
MQPISETSNRILDALPSKERKRLLAACEVKVINFGTVLCAPGDRYRHVYFPLTGIISLLTSLQGHPLLEMGLLGDEGMLGASIALGVPHAPLQAVVQGTGTFLRLPMSKFQRELRDCPVLLSQLKRYLYVHMQQLSQLSACTHFHAIEPRLARWLLMMHDRTHADHFHLTHEYLGDMLGVRRSGVTIAAGALQSRNLISYSRGEINILDRKGLESASCECYGILLNDYQKSMRS